MCLFLLESNDFSLEIWYTYNSEEYAMKVLSKNKNKSIYFAFLLLLVILVAIYLPKRSLAITDNDNIAIFIEDSYSLCVKCGEMQTIMLLMHGLFYL